MEPKVDLVACTQCGHVREKFLVGCPKCGNIANKEFNADRQVFYEVTLDTIQSGKRFFQKELTEEQRTFFADRIPNDQSWQFYAGAIIINNLNTVWLNDLTNNQLLSRDKWDDPISCGNARVLFVMSYKNKEKQQSFCDLINAYNHHRIRHEKDITNLQANIQGEDSGIDDESSPRIS